MDAIEFYHTDDCPTDIYEAMEKYNKHQLKGLSGHLESKLVDKGGMPLDGYEMAENDGINIAINAI